MKKKDTSHIGFRNGNLFCFHCGGSYETKMPMPISVYAKTLEVFSGVHADCKPTWKVPEPDMTQSAEQRMLWWLKDGEHGISSEAMFAVLGNGTTKAQVLNRLNHPCDPDDFRRCYLLLKAVPEFKSDLHKLKNISPVWSALVDNWEELTRMLEELMAMEKGKQKANGMYDLMKNIGC